MKKLSLPILTITAISVASVSLILRIVCILCFYETGYYTVGATLPTVANIFFVLAIIIFLVTAIFCIKKETTVPEPSKTARYAAILPIGASVFCAAQTVTKITSANEAEFLPVAILLCAIVSTVFFFLVFFAPKQKIAATYCGIGAIALVFFCWISSYFDFSSPINSIDRSLFYVSCGAGMLFIFNEICAIYGSVKARFYYFSTFAMIFATASSSIPAIVGFSAEKIEAYSNLEGDVFLSTLLVYSAVRLITLSKPTKIGEPTSTPATDCEIPEESVQESE